MPFYTFTQNNSGGRFDHQPESGIGYAVIVEAHSEADAVERAERIGLYFDGIESGQDCPCCGDRWSRYPWNEGSSEPVLHGEVLRSLSGGGELAINWGIPSYIHFTDGTFMPAAKAGGDA